MNEDEFKDRIEEAKTGSHEWRRLIYAFVKTFPYSGPALREASLLHFRDSNFLVAKNIIERSLVYDDCFWGRLFYAMIFEELKEYQASEREFKCALEKALFDPIGDGEQIVSKYYAEFLYYRGRFDEASQRALISLPFFERANPRDAKRMQRIILSCARQANQTPPIVDSTSDIHLHEPRATTVVPEKK